MIKAFIDYVKTNVTSNEKGQGMVEYALIVALIGVALVGALSALSGGIGSLFDSVLNKLGVS